MPRNPSLERFDAYLRRHGICLRELGRCIGRGEDYVRHAIGRANADRETIADIEAVLRASGYPVPRNLWVDTDGNDLRDPRPSRLLYTIGDRRVIRHRVSTPAYRAAVAHRQISLHQILKEENMQPLSPEAKRHFGLSFDPFTDEVRSSDDVFWTREHRHVVDTMLAAARRQSFLAIIGEVGSGKTICKQEFFERRPENIRLVEPLFPDKRAITPNNLLDAILCDLAGTEKVSIPTTRERKARRVRDILEGAEKEGQCVALVLDEAHSYHRETLRSLKRLHEFERGFARLISIILIGQLELLPKLNDPTLREVHQRCAQVVMHGLNGSCADYLDHKLQRAGVKIGKVLTPEAVTAIEKLCRHKLDSSTRWFGPYPLGVNVVTKAAINLAARAGEKTVTPDCVDRAWGTARQEVQ